jgi:hypothetical protein
MLREFDTCMILKAFSNILKNFSALSGSDIGQLNNVSIIPMERMLEIE